MAVQIVIDSTCDIKAELLNKVTVVPLTILFGDEEYVDGVTITNRGFYEKLIESDLLPTTSQATPDSFISVLDGIIKNGDEAVVITLSSKLSGTCQSANIAAGDYDNKVYVVDSDSVAIGTGILAEYALSLKEQGKTAREIADELNIQKEKITIVALLDTLEYLKRGGRISKTVAFAGGVLQIKPVISLENGEIKMLGKARGSKQGNNLLVEEIEKAGGVNFDMPLLLGYTGLSDNLLKKYIEDSEFLWKNAKQELKYELVGSVVGTHAGPGAIAVAFFKNK